MQEEVKSSSFVLCDEKGTERAKLSMVSGDPLLWFADASGHVKMTIGLTSGGDPRLLLADENGVGRVGIDLSDGGPSVFLRDAKGDIRLGLDFDEEQGLSVLTFCGDDSVTRLQMRVDVENSESEIAFFDHAKGPRIRLNSNDGDQSLSIIDGTGNVLALFSGGGVILTDQDGATRIITSKSGS